MNEYRGFNPVTKQWVYGCGTGEIDGVSVILTIGMPNKKTRLVYAGGQEVVRESVGKKLKSTSKNGGALYTGDICRLYNEDGELEDDFIEIQDKGDFFSLDYSSQPLSVLIFLGCSVEVVGNKFENPELLVRD